METKKRRAVALAVWGDRLAPVLDTATTFRVLNEPDQEDLPQARSVSLTSNGWPQWEAFLEENGVGILICGAVSRALEWRLQAAGVTVHGFRGGGVGEIWTAWREGVLEEERFYLPGCARVRGGGGRGWAGMKRRGGRGGQGSCACPLCGQRWLHEAGVPCQTRICPSCGVTLRRV